MTTSHVYEMMGGIRIGDRISFNSYGACETAAQSGRNGGAAIPALGTVLKVYPRYVMVRLKVARECIMWDGIIKVNGISWPICTERGV